MTRDELRKEFREIIYTDQSTDITKRRYYYIEWLEDRIINKDNK